MARWGMPGPPQYGGAPVTNIRNLSSPHWRGWLGKRNRCIVPATSFCEYADTKPRKTPKHEYGEDCSVSDAIWGMSAKVCFG
jgi:putative SOS response-associated peptidase YedK